MIAVQSTESLTWSYSDVPVLIRSVYPTPFAGPEFIDGVTITKDQLFWISTFGAGPRELRLVDPVTDVVSATIVDGSFGGGYRNSVVEMPVGTDVLAASASQVRRFGRDGSTVATYTPAVVWTITSIGIAADGDTLYYLDDYTIKRWQLSTDSALADFKTFTGAIAPFDFCVLSDDTVVVLWTRASDYATSDDNVNSARFNSSGTLVQAFNNPRLVADGYGDGTGIAVDAAKNTVWLHGNFDDTVDHIYTGALYKFVLSTGVLVSDTKTGDDANAQYPGVLSIAPSATPTTYQICRLRRAPHIKNDLKRVFYSRFELDMEVGLGTTGAPTTAPNMRLRWSDDGGHMWSSYYSMSAGIAGAYGTRMFRNQLGSARDRIFEVSTCDDAAWRLLAAYLEIEGGPI